MQFRRRRPCRRERRSPRRTEPITPHTDHRKRKGHQGQRHRRATAGSPAPAAANAANPRHANAARGAGRSANRSSPSPRRGEEQQGVEQPRWKSPTAVSAAASAAATKRCRTSRHHAQIHTPNPTPVRRQASRQGRWVWARAASPLPLQVRSTTRSSAGSQRACSGPSGQLDQHHQPRRRRRRALRRDGHTSAQPHQPSSPRRAPESGLPIGPARAVAVTKAPSAHPLMGRNQPVR